MIRFPQCVTKGFGDSPGRYRLLFLLFRYSISHGFIIFLLFSPLAAQTVGKIAGVVTEAATGEPLVGANIEIVGMMMGAATDEDGVYYILNIPPGKYELRISMIGYKTTKVVDVIVNAGKTTNLDFELEEEVLEGEEVVVTAVRPDVELDKTSTSAIIRFDEVETLPGIRDISDVLTLAADVYDGHFRGGREGEEYYILQGMGIVNPLDRSSAFLPIMSGVEEVEVITSGFGAQYGNAQSGIVNISMKEGDRYNWKTRIESRMRAPGRKHFGPSVFDPNANDYIKLLMNTETWREGEPGAEEPYFGDMASGLTSYFAGDTAVQVAVAKALWEQTKRDIGRTYGNEVDYSIETATGGPINEKMRMFVALRSNQQSNVFPTEQPNIEYQAMGNVVTDFGKGMVLRLSGGLTKENENVFPSENSVSGYQGWLWDRITGVRERKRVNTQLGARFTKTISQSTFYELKLNSLFTNNELGATPVPDVLPDSIDYGWENNVIAWAGHNPPDGFNYLEGYDEFTNEKTRTISFDGSFTSQVTKSHLVNAGLQLNSYYIDVSNFIDVREDNREIEGYTAHPFEAAAYAQDKMEFEGLIANVGLRFDLWYSGVDYYTDLFTPFGQADTTTGKFDPSNAERKTSPIYTGLQPRLGFSFPISENTVFHLNYGAFMQRPSFQYIVNRNLQQISNQPVNLGNPRLKPERTNSYDVGVVQGLGKGFALDISGYYKDVKNLVQEVELFDEGIGLFVNSYFNIDYADIRGFRVSLNKRRGSLTGSINYQYGYATGKSASATTALPKFDRDSTGVVTTDLEENNVPLRDIIMDFDRTHNLIITAGYVTGQEWGPPIFDSKPFADMNFSVRSTIQSGRPYTSTFERRQINEKRSPMEYNTDLRVTKTIRDLAGIPVSFYVEVFNLFNDKILNYDYLFDRPSRTNQNLPLQYYEQYSIDDKENGIRYWYNKGTQGPFSVDQSFLIYDNQPRSYSFGIVFEF